MRRIVAEIHSTRNVDRFEKIRKRVLRKKVERSLRARSSLGFISPSSAKQAQRSDGLYLSDEIVADDRPEDRQELWIEIPPEPSEESVYLVDIALDTFKGKNGHFLEKLLREQNSPREFTR